MKMRFKDFVFPNNPSKIKISSSTNISSKSIFAGNSMVSAVSVDPAVIRGEGEFFGNTGEEICQYFLHMLKIKTSGMLILPSQSSFKAYLSKFNFSKKADKSSISYSFEFIEDCSDKDETRDFCFTICRSGENAFVIANRCNISVSDIMRLNDFRTPFDINEGDRVVIR